MRVIAGTYKSRILKSLKGLALRPTSDRLRETLFNVLAPNIVGSRFIDLFAGTGAIGIEALSRGAAEVVFIENHAPTVTLIRRNLESLGITTGATVLAVDALRGLAMLAARKNSGTPAFDHIFLDPPYAAAEDYSRVLEFLGSADLLAPGGIVVAEHRRNFDLLEGLGALTRFRVLKQGDAALSFYRHRREAAGETSNESNSAK
jgi:16S rRNA (guanine(966)-N(2))-methyltransferase RsmD